MRNLILILTGLVLASPALARQQEQEPGKPINQRDVTAADVVTTPMNDLNLRKDEIPALLIAAQADPYNAKGIRRCGQIAAAIGELDAMLGSDLDLPPESTGGISAGRVAQAAVGAFIPFRGLIREITGANAQDRKLQAAVQAGVARRAFLKGYGQARGCRYPARAATPLVLAQLNRPEDAPAAATVAKPTKQADRRQRKTRVTFVSKPVVQQAP